MLKIQRLDGNLNTEYPDERAHSVCKTNSAIVVLGALGLSLAGA